MFKEKIQPMTQKLQTAISLLYEKIRQELKVDPVDKTITIKRGELTIK